MYQKLLKLIAQIYLTVNLLLIFWGKDFDQTFDTKSQKKYIVNTMLQITFHLISS